MPLWARAVTAGSAGELLAEVRRERGWTQEQLAEHVRVDRTTIQRMEAGRPVAFPTVLAAFAFLGYEVTIRPREEERE